MRWDGCRVPEGDYFDGDSFHVRWRGEEKIVRLYFVDAPETDAGLEARVREQAEYFGITSAQVLRGGQRAKAFTARFLHQPFSVITRWQRAPGASDAARVYGLIEQRGRRLDEALLAAGLARANSEVADYPDATAGHATALRLRAIEHAAKQSRAGLWAQSTRVDRAALARLLNLNTASLADLVALPGIGPKTAEAIIRARPLHSFEELDQVPGIGAKRLAALRGFVGFE